MDRKNCNIGGRVSINSDDRLCPASGDLFLHGLSGIPTGIYSTEQRAALEIRYPGRVTILASDVIDLEIPDHKGSFVLSDGDTELLRFDAEGGGDTVNLQYHPRVSAEKNPMILIEMFDEFFEYDKTLFFRVNPVNGFNVEKRGGGTIYVHKTASVSRKAEIDASHGDVIIDRDAVIAPFTFIEGPAYIGTDSMLDQAKIRKNTHIGSNCRISGEIEASLISSYTNKHHDGFIGHSILGKWINLGAMTTNSDLKNNYSNVNLPDIQGEETDTGMMKAGAIIGDHVKTGIGTLLNTGSRIGMGSMLYGGGMFPRYIPPFSWTDGKSIQEYRLDRFLKTAAIAMGRRGMELKADTVEIIKRVHRDSTAERQRVGRSWKS